MRSHIVAAVFLIATSNMLEPIVQAVGQTSGVDAPMQATLSSLRDRYRPLLVFAPADKDRRFMKQAQLFVRGSVSLHERQVLFVPLSYRKEAESWGVVLNSGQIVEFPRDEALEARRRFQVKPEDFVVILIGKDGGEKFRTHAPVTIDRLNAVIDAMPMRQQEVRNGNSK